MQIKLIALCAAICMYDVVYGGGHRGSSFSSGSHVNCWVFTGDDFYECVSSHIDYSSYSFDYSWYGSSGHDHVFNHREAIRVGCFADDMYSPLGSALPHANLTSRDMTPNMCFSFCWENNMRYAGLESGSQCFCGKQGTNYAKHGTLSDYSCQKECRGNDEQMCGGRRAIMVYDLRDTSSAQENDLRLITWEQAGNKQWYKGTVEIYKDSQWQAICDKDWSKTEADVVCRQLGYGNAIKAYVDGDASYWTEWEDNFKGDDIPLAYNDVKCEGSEVSLAACRKGVTKWANCDSSTNVGVQCDGPGSDDVEISLEGGEDQYEGVVVIKYLDVEGYVCADDDWDLADAAVICHKMDFGAAMEAVSDTKYGTQFNDGRPILLGNLKCSEYDKMLDHELHQCRHGQWNNTGCQSGQRAVVKCGQPGISEVRLADGPSENEGRLEILRDGVWGTVCDEFWGIDEASVACRMMGYPWAVSTTPSSFYYDSYDYGNEKPQWYGPGDGPIHLNVIFCKGYETTLEDCTTELSFFDRLFGFHSECGHGNDVGILCHNKSDSIVFGVRLVDGNKPYEGRVEIQFHGHWGSVCDDSWDINDANVVCRQLGMGNAVEASKGGTFGRGPSHSPILLDEIDCTGNEYYLSDCAHSGWNKHNCKHQEDAGVKCQGPEDNTGIRPWHPRPTRPPRPTRIPSVTKDNGIKPPRTKPPKRGLHVRLVDGSKESEGRVELSHKGAWSSVCNEGWDLNDANVVCIMLGYQGASGYGSYSEFGEGSGDILFSGFDCNGRERSLSQCDRAEENSCTHDQDAGVVCIDNDVRETSLAIRLVSGNSKSEGHVEVLRSGQWGGICDAGWNMKDAEVICRQLGFNDAVKATTGSAFGSNDGPVIASNVYCTGEETQLNECSINWDPGNECGAADHAGVVCGDDDGKKGNTDRNTDTHKGMTAGLASGLTLSAIVVLLIIVAVLGTVIFMRKKKKPSDVAPIIPNSHLSEANVAYINTTDHSQAIGGAIGGAPPVYTPTADFMPVSVKVPLDSSGVSADIAPPQANGETVQPSQAAADSNA